MKYLAQIDFTTLENLTGGTFRPTTLGEFVSRALPFLLAGAGMFLLLFLTFSGFKMMTSKGDPKALQSAKSQATAALIGFVVVFSAFWLVQLFGRVLGLQPIINLF